MRKYEEGDQVFTRKAKGYDKIYGVRTRKKRFGRKYVETVYLPEGLEGYVEYGGTTTSYWVHFVHYGSLLMGAFFLTKGTPLEDAEKGTEASKKAQGESSKVDFVVDEHGQATHSKEQSRIIEPIVFAPIGVPDLLRPQSVVKQGQGLLSELYENERTEAETELIKEVTKDIKDERRRRWWGF